MPSQEFVDLLGEMKELHERKGADYAKADNPFSNFEYAARLSAGFSDPMDRIFVSMIGHKLARLEELLGAGKVPNNESIDDTMRDLAVYGGLWTAYRRKMRAAA